MPIRRFSGSDVMLVLITYDVNTESSGGKSRLRRVAKICTDYGQRVQNSVFECLLDSAQLLLVKEKLLGIINEKEDSLRIYRLGEQYERKIEHFGAKQSYDPQKPFIL